MNKTAGFAKFEHLTDKSNVLLYRLKEEAEALAELANEVALLRQENEELSRMNQGLTSRVELLVEKKGVIDSRAGALLGALDDAHLL